MKKLFTIAILMLSSSVYPMWFWPSQPKVDDDIDFAPPKSLSDKELREKKAANVIGNWWYILKEHQALQNNHARLHERWRARTADERLQGLLNIVVQLDEHWKERDADERECFTQEVRELMCKPGTDAERRKDFVDLCNSVVGTGPWADACRAEFDFEATFDKQVSRWEARTEMQKREDAVKILQDLYTDRDIGSFETEKAQQDFSRVARCLQDPGFEFNNTTVEDWTAREIHGLVRKYPKVKQVIE